MKSKLTVIILQHANVMRSLLRYLLNLESMNVRSVSVKLQLKKCLFSVSLEELNK